MSTILRRVFPSDHLHCIAWQPKSYITQKSSKCAILIIIAVGSTWNLGIFIFKSLNYTGYKHKITWIQISPFLITHEHQSVWRVIVWFRGAETRLQLSGNILYAANFDSSSVFDHSIRCLGCCVVSPNSFCHKTHTYIQLQN